RRHGGAEQAGARVSNGGRVHGAAAGPVHAQGDGRARGQRRQAARAGLQAARRHHRRVFQAVSVTAAHRLRAWNRTLTRHQVMTEAIPIPRTSRRLKEEEKKKTKPQPPYNVILHNDDDHSFDYVIAMLQQLFGHPREKGLQMAWKVHNEGRVVVDTTSKERAE